jgi:hypothetical protein
MQASTYHVYKRESLKPNQYYKRQQVTNNIQGTSSQEPPSIKSRTQSNSIQADKNKFSSKAQRLPAQTLRGITIGTKRPTKIERQTSAQLEIRNSIQGARSNSVPNAKQRFQVPEQSTCHNRANFSHALDQQRSPNQTHLAQEHLDQETKHAIELPHLKSRTQSSRSTSKEQAKPFPSLSLLQTLSPSDSNVAEARSFQRPDALALA